MISPGLFEHDDVTGHAVKISKAIAPDDTVQFAQLAVHTLSSCPVQVMGSYTEEYGGITESALVPHQTQEHLDMLARQKLDVGLGRACSSPGIVRSLEAEPDVMGDYRLRSVVLAAERAWPPLADSGPPRPRQETVPRRAGPLPGR